MQMFLQPESAGCVIVHRTQSDQTANAIQSGGERNPIRWRTQHDILPSTFILKNGN